MADVIVTLKIMPDSPDADLEKIKDKAKLLITEFGGEVGKEEEQPVAFGIKALVLIFVMKEETGSTEPLEENIKKISAVQSVDVTDVRRAIG